MSESQKTPNETPPNETRASSTLAILGCGIDLPFIKKATDINGGFKS